MATRKSSRKHRSSSRKSRKSQSPWMLHVKKVSKENPGSSLKEILKSASKTYHK